METNEASKNESSHRIAQLNSLLLQEISQLIGREVELPIGVFVTVSRAEVAADAESAKIWLSVLPDSRAAEILEMVNHKISNLQHLLNRRLVMKFVPKITFLLDHSEEKAASINSILDALEKDPTLTPTDKPYDTGGQ